MKTQGQLTLSVQLPDDETFASYKRLEKIESDNSKNITHAAAHLEKFVKSFVTTKQRLNSFYLFGISGVGKSHLLHACCSLATELGLSSQCLSMSELLNYSSDIFLGLENIDLICVDDIHVISGTTDWERGIFDLFNRLMEHNKCIIVSGNESVNKLGIQLPDLNSRLSWGHVEQLKQLTDEEKVHALQFRALQRGLILTDDSGKFLVNHLSRNMNDLINSLNKLDQASIKEQRKLTIPFIKETLFTTN